MTKQHIWKVVPLSKGQLLDVRPEDILNNGLFRRCDTYRGGGGYDLFPGICDAMLGVEPHEQFIVQLKGCNLDCPYCYVTREGVWGSHAEITTEELVISYQDSGLPVFHLMGGAPALQLKFWPELLKALSIKKENYIFHSDLMLTEGLYSIDVLEKVAAGRTILAVNIKGTNDAEWIKNTRKDPDWILFWNNFRRVQSYLTRFYITFTGCSLKGIHNFSEAARVNDVDLSKMFSYNIDLINYNAAPHVDDVPWGLQGERL